MKKIIYIIFILLFLTSCNAINIKENPQLPEDINPNINDNIDDEINDNPIIDSSNNDNTNIEDDNNKTDDDSIIEDDNNDNQIEEITPELPQLPEVITNTVYFNETIEEYDSPDCGFYDPVYISCTDDGVTSISNNYLKYNNLLHLRIDISQYSKANNQEEDLEFSNIMLTNLSNQFERMYNASTSVIVRFAYDPGYNGAKDKEPSIEMMKKHISQLKDLFYKYQNIITAIECGMVGPWGEMHSSIIANQATYNELISSFLANTPNTIPILVRRPQFLYSYYGYNINNINDLVLDSSNRIGVYNDGYLGSGNDLGTYNNRELEVNWLSKVNKYLPYGGEVTIPNSTYNLLENCNEEMNLLGLSYLNEYWNDQVVKRWKETKYNLDNELYKESSQFTYIRNHMGYRLVLNSVTFTTLENNCNISFDIKNVGFGNLLKPKKYTLIFKNDFKLLEFEANMNTYNNLSFDIDISNLNDSYDIYLKISDGYVNNIPFHSIRLSNNIWDQELYANKIITNIKLNP